MSPIKRPDHNPRVAHINALKLVTLPPSETPGKVKVAGKQARAITYRQGVISTVVIIS